MAIVEIQIRERAFLAYVQAQLNFQRLRWPTVPVPVPGLTGRLLERTECTGCTVVPASGGGAGPVVIDASLVIYSTTGANAKAAGSMQPPATTQVPALLRLSLSIANNSSLQMQPTAFSIGDPSLIPAQTIPLSLPSKFSVKSSAIVVGSGAVVIRLGTQTTDSLFGPVANQLGADDWVQLVEGQVFVEQLVNSLTTSVEDQRTKDSSFSIEHYPAGIWVAGELPAILRLGNGPMALATVELGDSTKCAYGIEISMGFTLTGRLRVAGLTLVNTIRLTWSIDSFLCDIVGALVFNAIYATVFHIVAKDIASSQIFGRPSPAGLREIDRDDESITYEMTLSLATPGSWFRFARSEATAEGLLIAGSLPVVQPRRRLEGQVEVPAFAVQFKCNPKSISVAYRPPGVFLRDFGLLGGPSAGPPNVFPNGVTITPPGAWIVVPGSNESMVRSLTFADPPTGRLPPGTATSALIQTDCGIRWVDLGVIPASRGPSESDNQQMDRICDKLSDRWGLGALDLEWLPDPTPRYSDIDAVREWTVAFDDLVDDVRLEFVARKADGSERLLGVASGRRNNAVQVITDADETLEIRTGRQMNSPTPVVLQRWITPFAVIPMAEDPIFIAAAHGLVGIIGADGKARIIELDGRDESSTAPLDEAATNEASLQLVNALTRRQQHGRQPWAYTARVDANTVATTHRGAILIGTPGPTTKL